MAKAKGKIYPYVVGDNVNTYLKGVELYFELNKTPGDVKLGEFLTRVGQSPMDCIISSFKPEEITQKTYDQVKAKFKSLYEGHNNAFGQRHRLVTKRCWFNQCS